MQNKIIIGLLAVAFMASAGLNFVLLQKVAQQDKQLKPVKAQQTAQARQASLRANFDQKTALDRQKHSLDQLADAENLYQVANKKWGTLEASNSLQTMIEKYPDINRTGCAVLYVAQMSKGDVRGGYLQDCIDKYNDCFYGDGVQVGVYARFLMAQDYRGNGEREKADDLFNEIKSKYPDAVDHSGNLLVNLIKANKKLE